jgi:hypothetical protein
MLRVLARLPLLASTSNAQTIACLLKVDGAMSDLGTSRSSAAPERPRKPFSAVLRTQSGLGRCSCVFFAAARLAVVDPEQPLDDFQRERRVPSRAAIRNGEIDGALSA